jgi:hypothetical protein
MNGTTNVTGVDRPHGDAGMAWPVHAILFLVTFLGIFPAAAWVRARDPSARFNTCLNSGAVEVLGVTGACATLLTVGSPFALIGADTPNNHRLWGWAALVFVVVRHVVYVLDLCLERVCIGTANYTDGRDPCQALMKVPELSLQRAILLAVVFTMMDGLDSNYKSRDMAIFIGLVGVGYPTWRASVNRITRKTLMIFWHVSPALIAIGTFVLSGATDGASEGSLFAASVYPPVALLVLWMLRSGVVNASFSSEILPVTWLVFALGVLYDGDYPTAAVGFLMCATLAFQLHNDNLSAASFTIFVGSGALSTLSPRAEYIHHNVVATVVLGTLGGAWLWAALNMIEHASYLKASKKRKRRRQLSHDNGEDATRLMLTLERVDGDGTEALAEEGASTTFGLQVAATSDDSLEEEEGEEEK